MAVKGTLARILVDEVDLSCETSAVTMTNSISEDEVTTLCSTAAEYEAILPSIAISQDGYMKTVNDPGSFEEEMYSRMGVAGSMVAALFGIDLPACVAYIIDNSFGASMEINAPAAGVMTLNGAWGQGKGGHRGVRIVDANVIAGGTPVVDLGATGADGGECYLFLQGVTGSLGTATINLTHCTTAGGTYLSLGVFSVTALGAYKLVFGGTVNQFVRVNVTSLGGTTALDLVIVICVRGVTE